MAKVFLRWPGVKHTEAVTVKNKPKGRGFRGSDPIGSIDENLMNLESSMQRSASTKRTDPYKNIGFVRINALFQKKLRFPLDVILDPDGDGCIARTVDLPLYALGDDPFEAITLLKRK